MKGDDTMPLKTNRICFFYSWTLVMAFGLFLVLSGTAVFAECESIQVVEGRAAILTDPATARDRALIDARVKAVEKCGVMVEERSVVNMGLSLDHFAQVKAFAFVKAYDILKEWEKDDIYYVRIKAWIKEGTENEKARKELLSSRLILMLADGDGADTLESVMKEKLTGLGFSLLDSDFIKQKVSPAIWQCLKTGNLSCVGKELYPFLANYLIRINSEVKKSQNLGEGIMSFRANSKISCTQISTAFLKPYSRKCGVIFGLDGEQALCGSRPDQFERKIAEPLCSEFMEKLSKEFNKSKRNIRVSISGLPDKDAFDNFKLLVRELRWVGNISNESYNQGIGSLSVPYTEKSVYLASMIAFRSVYNVMGYTWDRIDVTYKGS